ncbi:hypothetical protein ACFPK1_28610, partial [Actinomycetospora rhizophila]
HVVDRGPRRINLTTIPLAGHGHLCTPSSSETILYTAHLTGSTESGTLNLSGLDLPLDAGALSVAHVEALVFRAKAAGHPGLIDTIRADVYLALLSPRPRGWDDDALVAHVVAHAAPGDPRGRTTPRHVGAEGPGPGGGTPRSERGTDDPADDQTPHGPAPDRPAPDDPDDRAPGVPAADGPSDVPPDGSAAGGGAAAGGSRSARIEMRIGLLTLLGLDEKPGTMPGYGVVHAPFARQFARQLCGAEWRVAVTDDESHLIAALVTRRRPRGYATTPQQPTIARPVLELHISQAELARRLREPGTWGEVLTDLRDQLRAWTGPPTNPEEARRRFPSAALARWIRSRDRTCVFPPCRTSSLVADIDHTLAVNHGGITVEHNLDPVCRHDHRLKHEAGWHLAQPAPGRFVWTSPTGHTYDRPPRPVRPDLPDPAPGRHRSATTPAELAGDEPVWINDPYPDGPPSRPPPRAVDDPEGDDEPPF